MSEIWMSVLYGCIVGSIGTGSGAAIAFLIKSNSERLMSVLMAISGGIMIAIVFFDMCPNAILYVNAVGIFAGAALGAAFVFAAEIISNIRAKSHRERSISFLRLGILIMVSIGVHNLPEGLAIGSGLAIPGDYGMGFGLLIMLHNIPEGMAMAIPMHMGGMKPVKGVLLAVLAGAPTALGAGLGMVIGAISKSFIGCCIAFAAGAMLFVTLKELIPESVNMGKSFPTIIAIAAGVLIGVLMVAFIQG